MKNLFPFLLLLTLSAHAQWEKIPTLSADIEQGLIMDDQRYVVMGNGTAYYSEDAGKTWKQANMGKPTYFILKKLERISTTEAVAIGYKDSTGLLLKTIDAGKNWKKIGQFNQTLTDIQFLSPDTGYFGFSNPIKLKKTVDGGLHWDDVPLPGGSTGGSIEFRFWNGKFGYSGINRFGQPSKFYKTTDGGQSWIETASHPAQTSGAISCIQILSPDRVMYFMKSIGDPGKWFLVSDGGLNNQLAITPNNWTYETKVGPLYKSGPGKFGFKTYNTFSFGSINGLCHRYYYQTTDNGVSCSEDDHFPDCLTDSVPNQNPQPAYHLEVAEGGRIFKADAGSHYRTQLYEGYIGNLFQNRSGELASVSKYGIQFLDSAFQFSGYQLIGWGDYLNSLNSFGGFGGVIPMGEKSLLTFLYSDINYEPWAYFVQYPIKYADSIKILNFSPKTIRFVHDSNLVATGTDTSFRLYSFPDGRMIKRTLPTGLSSLTSPQYEAASGSIYFLANQSRIYKTNDSAKTWQETTYPQAYGTIGQLHFLNENMGFSFGTHISRTTDGGQTWQQSDTNTYSSSPWSVHFINENTGFAYGSSLLKTTNAGLSWDPVSIPIHPNNVYINMVFSPLGEGIIHSRLDSNLWFYHPESDVWTTEFIPAYEVFGAPVYDFVRNRWILRFTSDYPLSCGALVRKGGPVVPTVQLQLMESQLCPGDSIPVEFVFHNLQNLTQAEVQLSDAQGSFANPLTLGTLSLSRSQNEIHQLRRFALPIALTTGGSYRVRLQGNFKFESSVAAQQFILRTAPIVNVASSDTLCQYSTHQFTGAPSGGFWTSTVLNFDGTLKAGCTPGTYSSVYHVQISETCQGSDTMLVTVNDSPEPATIWLENGILRSNLTQGFAFQWKKDGQAVGLPGDTSLIPTGSGAFWFEAKNATGCSSSSNVILITSVPSKHITPSLHVFPNPASGSFTVQSSYKGRGLLFNEMGVKVRDFDLQPSEANLVSLKDLPEGVYFLKGVSATHSEVKKVLVIPE